MDGWFQIKIDHKSHLFSRSRRKKVVTIRGLGRRIDFFIFLFTCYTWILYFILFYFPVLYFVKTCIINPFSQKKYLKKNILKCLSIKIKYLEYWWTHSSFSSPSLYLHLNKKYNKIHAHFHLSLNSKPLNSQ